MPRFRQKMSSSPYPLPPRWSDDRDFDLSFHVRRVTAPEPGAMDAVLEMARVAAMADFDRSRPLWEATLIEGLSDGGAALLLKLHHALTDGIGAVRMASILFDLKEGSRQLVGVPATPPPAEEGTAAFLRGLAFAGQGH